MKKIFSICALAAALFSFASCDSDSDIEAGGTSIEKMAGYWDIRYDVVDTDGTVYEDGYGLGTCPLYTYNTTANNATEMWIDDLGEFWAYKFKCPINYVDLTFSCTDVDYDDAASGKATITNGKVLLGAGHNIHGMPCDSIVFDIKFSDDDNGYTYHVEGVKHSGFYE